MTNVSSTASSFDWKFIVVGILIGGIICALVYFIFIRKNTLPMGAEGFKMSRGSSSIPKEGFLDEKKNKSEGFAGSNVPDCLKNSPESAAIVSFFLEKGVGRTEEGSPDFEELKQILSKMACLQKDLTSPSHLVNSTRGLSLSTMHDVEPVADTAARCFNKSIPPRDLQIVLDKWNQRGMFLLKRLCVSANLNSSQVENMEELFKKASVQCRQITKDKCLVGEPTITGVPAPRQVDDNITPDLADLAPYQSAPW